MDWVFFHSLVLKLKTYSQGINSVLPVHKKSKQLPNVFEIASFKKLSLCGKKFWCNRLGKVNEEMNCEL